MTFGSTMRINLRRCIGKLSKKRVLLLLGLAALTLSAVVPEADAFVCARGVYRAGCVGPRGAAVARRPIYGAYYGAYRGCFWRAGVRICR
jgi:hypothetical protein